MSKHRHISRGLADKFVRGLLEPGARAVVDDTWRFCGRCYARVEDARDRLNEEEAANKKPAQASAN